VQGVQPRPQHLDSFFYNSSTTINSKKKYRWDLNTMQWEPSLFSKYMYNSNNMTDVVEHTSFFSATSKTYYDSFDYDNQNRLVGKLLGNRVSVRWRYTYHSSGLLNEDIEQRPVNGTWSDWSKIENSNYDNNQNLLEKVRKYKGMAQTNWEQISRATYSYDFGSNKLLEIQYSYRNNGNWVTGSKEMYAYNTDNTLKAKLTQTFDGSSWNNFARDLYFYKGGATSLRDIKNNSIKIYPNPTNGKFTIELGDIEPSAIIITDIMGKQVYTTRSSGDLDIDLTNLQKGIYLVNINSGAKSSTQKIVVH
jgi:YD repeat-containing protein